LQRKKGPRFWRGVAFWRDAFSAEIHVGAKLSRPGCDGFFEHKKMALAQDDFCGKTILVRQRGDGHIAEKLGKYREIDGCQFSIITDIKQ
jgi:hypothetical protein